jgi:hypothetical protein
MGKGCLTEITKEGNGLGGRKKLAEAASQSKTPSPRCTHRLNAAKVTSRFREKTTLRSNCRATNCGKFNLGVQQLWHLGSAIEGVGRAVSLVEQTPKDMGNH